MGGKRVFFSTLLLTLMNPAPVLSFAAVYAGMAWEPFYDPQRLGSSLALRFGGWCSVSAPLFLKSVSLMEQENASTGFPEAFSWRALLWY